MNVPVMNVAMVNPRRNKILAFVAENGQVSKKDFVSFLNKMNEEEGSKIGWGYVKANAYFFKVKESKESGEKFVELSNIGKNVLRKTTVNECQTFEEVVGEATDVTDLQIKYLAARGGYDLENFDTTQIKLGLAMTIENNGEGAQPQYNIFGLDMERMFQLVIGNLAKDKNYYLKLSQEQFQDWPNVEDKFDDQSTEEYNELWDKKDKSPEDMICNANIQVEEAKEVTNDSRIEKIAVAHLVSKEQIKKEFELGVSIEKKDIFDQERAEAKALENLAHSPSYYSNYAINHWTELTEKQKELAQALGVGFPKFVDPMPVSNPEEEHKTPEEPEAPAEPATPATPIGESKDDDDDDDREECDDDDDREEWEQPNTGCEQPLLDNETRETLLSKDQQVELNAYLKEHGKLSSDKIKEFAEKFKIKESTLKSYLKISGDMKESYEIGKRYTISGYTGIVIAESEDKVVMSQRGKMILLEKEDKDEFC